MSKTADLLRQAADAIVTAEKSAEYLANPPNDGRFGVTIEWTWGSGSNKAGYAAIRERVLVYINEQMDDLVKRAVREILCNADEKQDLARKSLR